MVSRLIASLSGMLSSSPAEEQEPSQPTEVVEADGNNLIGAIEAAPSTADKLNDKQEAVLNSPKLSKSGNLKPAAQSHSGAVRATGLTQAPSIAPTAANVGGEIKKKTRRRVSKSQPKNARPPLASTPGVGISASTAVANIPDHIPDVKLSTRRNRSPVPSVFADAESLDKAIVQKLQSKLNPSLESPAPPPIDSGLGLGLSPSELAETGSIFDLPSGRPPPPPSTESFLLGGNYTFPDTHASSRPSTSTGLSQAAESLGKFTERIDDIIQGNLEKPEEHDNQDLASEGASTITGGHRIYKNRQFSLENTSKEALASDSIRDVDMLSTTESSVNPAVFIAASRYFASGSSVRPRSRSRSRSPGRGTSVGFSPSFTSTLGQNLFESTMNEIIESGGEEFKRKYSTWVWEAFKSHLTKMKSILLTEFTKKMQETLEEREMEVAELQREYREKLAEFDVTTEGFQRMIDTLHKDNQRVLKSKDSIIERLKKEFMEIKKHFEQDLARQMESYRKEAEVEKLELQKRNDELMMIMLTDANKTGGLEDSFKREIESLHKMIRALTNQNEILHQQIDEATSSTTVIDRREAEVIQTKLDQAVNEITELRNKLQTTEREKEDLTVTHHQEIAKLNRKLQESGTHYDHKLRDASEEIENLRKKYLRDVKDFRQKVNSQEAQYNNILSHMKTQYGGQVEELSKVVSQLQADLSNRVGSTGNR